ncbi:MAG: M20 family metallopeptidase [Sulfolobaceae archaeon]
MEDLIKLISELVKIPTVNPSGENLYEGATFIRDWLKERGINALVIEYSKGWPVVIAEKKVSEKLVLLNGHYDVVPIGDKNKWNFDPFSGKITQDRILGRGSTDMKGGLGILMKVFEELYDKINYSIIFTAVPDEEIGGKNGSYFIAQNYNPELVLVAEPSTSRAINIGEKGLFQIKLITKGKTAHGSLPSLGDNAIMKIVKDLISLSRISDIEIKIPEELSELVKETLEIIPHSEVFRISYNPGVIRGGVKVNVVPDYCEVEVDMRIPPGINRDKALEYVKSLITYSEIEFIDHSEPNYTDPNNKYVKLLENVITKTLEYKPKKYIMTGATDSRFFRYKKIPAIVYGPGELGTAHSYNEYVTIEEVKKVYNVYKNYLIELNQILLP